MVESDQNHLSQSVDSLIHSAIMGVAMNAALAEAEVAIPWLRLPVVHQIFKLSLNYIFDLIDKKIEQAAAFAILDAQTNQEAASYQRAVSALKTAQSSGDAHAIAQATDFFKTTLSRLIHSDGS